LKIQIFYDKIDFRLKGWRKAVKVIDKVIRNENKILGDLNFIITNDKHLRNINVEFLKHDYYTDVIAFNYSIRNVINGEVYISLETVKKNSLKYNVSLNKEVLRVLFHGVLHLIGYNDKTKLQRNIIKNMENVLLGMMEE
jgi:probable rRNA maturation factor